MRYTRVGRRVPVLNHDLTKNSCPRENPTQTKHSVTVNQAMRTQLDSTAEKEGGR